MVQKLLNYSKKRLTSDVQYNVSLGSYYLYSLIEDYDSYLLALIGYNAGPRRVKRWIKKFGDPRKENVDYDSWIEKIPIKETRLYVKIVLSNLQVYRQKNQTSKKISIFSSDYLKTKEDAKNLFKKINENKIRLIEIPINFIIKKKKYIIKASKKYFIILIINDSVFH